ncbi:SHOCT domain-containing protein [Streptomyces neyagawaensis]|uniref:SHOCT domain-containing protein n=1 Tax=Streptomyces neyagawaensis TaxID=42238 RepID=UPI0006E248BF|nr:SHOCT domain-containing protein [Streptomyces neyagawaensis]MCL6735976.1 SHOCT domain-containing protein [Streptomyces neyagawaensis]MDE1686894.1 SHOCT domain-containing protein [Streptomyces neyagawaensis]
MFWYGHDLGGWGWFVMSAGMILFWAALIALGVLLFRSLSGASGADKAERSTSAGGANTWVGGPPPGGLSPEQLLAERFARGDIDEDEYRRRLTVLRSGTSAPSGTP